MVSTVEKYYCNYAIFSVRLHTGFFNHTGAVYVKDPSINDDNMGTICFDGFGNTEAMVVCRELGFEGGDVFTATFGDLMYSVVIANLTCIGTEFSILKCNYTTSMYYSNCPSNQYASVKCYDNTLENETGKICDYGVKSVLMTLLIKFLINQQTSDDDGVTWIDRRL